MILKFIPAKRSNLDTALDYILYKLIKTDLPFAQAQKIITAVSAMDIANHPEKIKLSMRPSYAIQDIVYDSENISENLSETLDPIKHQLSKDDYSETSKEDSQINLLDIIEKNKDKPEFISWAYKNNLWLQIEDEPKRLATQYDLVFSHLSLLSDKKERELVLVNYILEMENQNELLWQEKAKNILAKEMGY